jgi:hypothetical protein
LGLAVFLLVPWKKERPPILSRVCLRTGETDATSGLVEIKDIADLKLDDIRQGWSGVMSGLFA